MRTTPGFGDAYKAIAEGGWVGIAASGDFGGMGLPEVIGTAVNEFLAGDWKSSSAPLAWMN